MYNMFRIGAEIFDSHKVHIQNFTARREALQLFVSLKFSTCMSTLQKLKLHYLN